MSSQTDTSIKPAEAENSVLAQLFEPLPDQQLNGDYDPSTQTWSHRDAKAFSPVKLNREM